MGHLVDFIIQEISALKDYSWKDVVPFLNSQNIKHYFQTFRFPGWGECVGVCVCVWRVCVSTSDSLCYILQKQSICFLF